MKIGFIANSSWNLYNFRSALICALQDHGHQVIAIAPADGYSDRLEEMGCVFVPVVGMHVKGTNPIQDLRLMRQLCLVYQEQQLDVVLHYTIKPNIYGTLAARWAGIPAINNVTGLGTVFLRHTPAAKVARYLYRLAFQYPQKVFFQNDDDRQLFIRKKLVQPDIADLVPGSGIDTAQFLADATTPKTGRFTFLMIARLLYDKGIVEYIQAIRLLKSQGVNARFLLLGRINADKGLGVSPEQVQDWEAEGLIEYLGVVDDVRPVIASAHAVVLPSYREGTPRTLLEAASMSRPLVATDVPGCRETIKDGYNGFLCQVKDARSLAEKMAHLYWLPETKRQEMGQNSRRFVEEHFAVDLVIKKYEEALQSFCAIRSDAPLHSVSSGILKPTPRIA